MEDLSKLTNLKQLHLQLNVQGYVRSKRHEDVLMYSLCKLDNCKLQSLRIHSSDSGSMEFLDSWSPLPRSLKRFRMSAYCYFLKIPNWTVPELTSLAYLNINLTEIVQEDIHVLGGLHAFLSLELWSKTDPKERLIVHDKGFPCLKEFYIIVLWV